MNQRAPEMKIKALAPWFGGKRTLAPRIVAELGPHDRFFDPFCGSMAVLMAKPAVKLEMVNDMHGDLINLALVVRHELLGPRLFRMLRRTLFHEELAAQAVHELEHWWGAHVQDPPEAGIGKFDAGGIGPDTERAYWYFVASWFARNGFGGTVGGEIGFCLRYTDSGGDPVVRFRAAVNSIAGWRRRLESVTITRRDGFEVLDKIPDAEGVAVYVDPPYVEKSAEYVFDFSADDHGRLREALRRFKKARVVVSYYDCDRVRELYRSWRFVDCAMDKATAHGSRGSAKSPEVLIVNDGGGHA
jgi:DNA adenine methylase